jgi:uncharacterized protein
VSEAILGRPGLSAPDRHRQASRKPLRCDAFFPKIAEFQKPPRHPKWREVNLSATLPGWNRFEAAQAWLDNQRLEAQRKNPNGAPAPAEQAAASGGMRSASGAEQPKQTVDPALFQEFLRWRQLRGQ